MEIVCSLSLCLPHAAVPPQGVLVAFDPAFVVVVEADVNVDVCFAVTGSLSQSFSVTVAINSAASTATLGK